MKNQETISLYTHAAEEELSGAQHNVDGGFYGIAVSRAYYAILYAASAILLTHDIVRSKHSAVLSAFRQHFVKPGLIEKIFSDTFGEAFELRQVADYDMLITTEKDQALVILTDAREFVARMINFIREEEHNG